MNYDPFAKNTLLSPEEALLVKEALGDFDNKLFYKIYDAKVAKDEDALEREKKRKEMVKKIIKRINQNL